MTISPLLFIYSLSIAAFAGAWIGYEERGHHDRWKSSRKPEPQAGRATW